MRINDNNYVDKAENVIKSLSEKIGRNGKPIEIVTTSKLRNLLAMVSDLYNYVIDFTDDKLTEDITGRISYMRMRFYYEAGREPKVKELFEEAEVFDIIKEIGTSRKNYILFSRYMESLVAFRKFYGKNDD